MSVLLETTLGDLVIDLFTKERPNSSLNFLKLCKMKYYNLCQFHSIEQNYVAQTGDPSGTGRGGESIFTFVYGDQARFFEKEDLPKMKHTRIGIVSFVNNGSNMLGSQFFITLGDGLDYLDDKHTIFGQVTEGLDTLEKLNQELCDNEHKPYKDIRIAHTIVLHDPFEDLPKLRFPSRSPSPTLELLVTANQIALDEKIDENEGKSAEEVVAEMQRREMAEQAQILEMVGDLRDADEAPPDNVLFVCKLNAVTTDEDLEIIFSRFGKIIKCEVIRDRRTQQSLQYAFIEFEDPKSCEQAFFKMDNVLIDDRRIHVDFSQSVAKNYKWNRGDKNDIEKRNENSQDGNRREERPKIYTSSKIDREIQEKKDRDYLRRENKDYSSDRKRRSSREIKREYSNDRSYEKRRRSRSGDRRGCRHHLPKKY